MGRHAKAGVARGGGQGSSRKTTKTQPHTLEPAQSVLRVGQSTLRRLPPTAVTPDNVGLKALGLSALPADWVPPFFVVDADAAAHSGTSPSFAANCRKALERSGIGPEAIVRSSGAAETMQERGRLLSEVCPHSDVHRIVHQLSKKVREMTSSTVHWLVERWVQPSRSGHLSNERHLVYEPRDWVVEVDLQRDAPGYRSSVAIRRWRDAQSISPAALWCNSEAQVGLRLKPVAQFGLNANGRMHFEWVWSGSRLWIVQADLADPPTGVDPITLLPPSLPRVHPGSLSLFSGATAPQLNQYVKLRNARLYAEMGYRMPDFYVLEESSVINEILSGHVPESLEPDLAELTKRPLIIRTDGVDIPPDKREMLPRSDELRSSADARSFLEGPFRKRIHDAQLAPFQLCLLGHHFIPSIASAWARAEPLKRMVRVESLWGLPEGLYWYSHDTFEVDVETGRHTERLRYKGTFIAADHDGRWVPMRTLAPADWRRSIRLSAWISEVARTTRAIADREEFPVAVMWFVHNDVRATTHRVLPWYHNRSDLSGLPKAAPRKKLTTARDYKIEARADWERIKSHLLAGRHIERIIVEPMDADLIRDRLFAEEVGRVAAQNQLVVELAGGLLSHAYYVLARHGAQVECVDLYGAGDEVREYNKLVRDKIPSSIQGRGEGVEAVQLKGDAYLVALKQKLVEEAFEALDARGGNELVGELADVQEVIRAVCKALGVPLSLLESERDQKRSNKGGFDNGMMLKRTSTPHTLSSSPLILELQDVQRGSPREAVSRPDEIPAKPLHRRPDLRTVGTQPEKLFTFETELARTDSRAIKQATGFAFPTDAETSRQFTLVLEFGRHRGGLRGTIRLRLEPQQLPIDLGSQLEIDYHRGEEDASAGKHQRKGDGEGKKT